MKELRKLLDKVYLVYYVVIDTSNECSSKKFYYADIVFKNFNSAYSYVSDANNTYGSYRDYNIVCVPII